VTKSRDSFVDYVRNTLAQPNTSRIHLEGVEYALRVLGRGEVIAFECAGEIYLLEYERLGPAVYPDSLRRLDKAELGQQEASDRLRALTMVWRGLYGNDDLQFITS